MTQFVGASGSSLLVPGRAYRVTFASDAGWYDTSRFPQRFRAFYDAIPATGLCYPATPDPVASGDTAATVDVRADAASGNASLARMAQSLEDLSGGDIHVARIEALGADAKTSTTGAAAARDSASTAASTSLANDSLTSKVGAVVSHLEGDMRWLVVALGVGVVGYIIMTYGPKRGGA